MLAAWSRLRAAFDPYLGGLMREVDEEMLAYRREHGHAKANLRALWVVVTAVACAVIIKYLGGGDDIKRVVGLIGGLGFDEAAADVHEWLRFAEDKRLNQRIVWCVVRIVGYGVLPALVIRFVLRERLAAYGLSLRGAGHARTYLLLFAVVVPPLVLASYGAGFQAKYPYYRFAEGEALWPTLLYWELLYGSQFFALELFFRGLLIHGLRQTLGYSAVFFPIVPYVMIHFGKPLPEALGSAIAGFVLGTLSLKTRSIVGGACIHVAVAVSMDLLSLWHRGFFG